MNAVNAALSRCPSRPAGRVILAALERSLASAILAGVILGAVYGLVFPAALFVAAGALAGEAIGGLVVAVVFLVGYGLIAMVAGAAVGMIVGPMVGLLAWTVAALTPVVPWVPRRVAIAVVPPVVLAAALSAFALAEPWGPSFWLMGSAGLVIAIAVYVRAPEVLQGLPGVPPAGLSDSALVEARGGHARSA